MTINNTAFVPPAAEGLPAGVLDSAAKGAAMLDASANTPYGRNLLAHALVRLQRDGFLSLPPADAEQQHLVDEIAHPEFVEAVHRDFAKRCGECGQPLPTEAR